MPKNFQYPYRWVLVPWPLDPDEWSPGPVHDWQLVIPGGHFIVIRSCTFRDAWSFAFGLYGKP